MRKAIAGCKAFYEKDYHADAAEDFATDEGDESDGDETVSRQQAIDALLAGECGIDLALSPEYISHAAWVYLNDTARYVKLKNHIPREIGARPFEREVQKQLKSEFTNNTKTPVQRCSSKASPSRECWSPKTGSRTMARRSWRSPSGATATTKRWSRRGRICSTGTPS